MAYPRPFLRVMAWLLIAPACSLLALVLGIDGVPMPAWTRTVVQWGPLALGLAIWLVLLLRLRRQVLAHKGRLCRRCAYPLDPPYPATCPECGSTSSADGDRDAWIRVFPDA